MTFRSLARSMLLAPFFVLAQPQPNALAQAAPPTAAQSQLTAQQIAQNIQQFYDATRQFEADFVQLSHNRLSGANDRRDGHVRFEKPGRMRWDYTHPPGDVIVSDGTSLWAYEAGAHQASQVSLRQSQLPSALSFLTGTGRLTDDFTFRRLPQPANDPTNYYLELRPVQANPSFERLLFIVEPAHFQVITTVIFDAQSNSNRIDFVRPQVNVAPTAGTFSWSPPAGTQIVRQ